MGDLTAFAKSNTAARIRTAAQSGALSHALILTGGAQRLDAARYAAAAMQCTAAQKPCLRCVQCRKVAEDIHPDVLTVQENEKRELSAERVRAMRSDVFIRPNEGARKVYLFPDCRQLNEKDQNILLKTVEEGPPYAAFLFCAESAHELLQTIRSRCVELKLPPQSAAQEDERADALCRVLSEKNAASRAAFLFALESKKLTRDELSALLGAAGTRVSQALLTLYGVPCPPQAQELCALLARSLSKRQLIGTIDLLQNYRKQCEYNVGVGALLGGLAAEWEELL